MNLICLLPNLQINLYSGYDFMFQQTRGETVDRLAIDRKI